MPRLSVVVTETSPGRYQCSPELPIGACIVGRGGSVLEAVGDYAIQTELLRVRTDPPRLVDKKFRLDPQMSTAGLLIGCDRRD